VKRTSILIFFTLLATASADDPKLSFEAASIKAGDHILNPSCMVGPGTLEYRCWANISGLIESALGMPTYAVQQEKAPLYFIDAKLAKSSSQPQLNAMLLNLLVDRFGLTYHMERREVEGYFVGVDPNGSKLATAAELPGNVEPIVFAVGRPGAARPPVRLGSFDLNGPSRSRLPGDAELIGKAVTMKMLVRFLSSVYQLVVADETGLAGTYDFVLDYKDPNRPEQMESQWPDLWSAVQKQLGLKMTHRKGMIDFLAIDHFEKVPKE